MTKKPFDAAGILRTLEEIRKVMPRPSKPFTPPAPRHDGRMTDAVSEEDFEMLAVAEGLESLAAELSAALREKERSVFEQALDIYYTAEDLARDGQHPDLVPHVEAMREAYEKSYGLPIPPREKREGAYDEVLRLRERKGSGR